MSNKEIGGQTAAEIFVNAIEAIGVERVVELGLKLSGIALVSRVNVAEYQGVAFRSGFYRCTHSSNKDKKKTLDEIANRLGVALTATVTGASDCGILKIYAATQSEFKADGAPQREAR